MFNQIEDMVINTLVQKLNTHGLNLDPETVKRAVANSPQLAQQIETILLASSTQDRLAKIKTLISQAAGGTTPNATNVNVKPK